MTIARGLKSDGETSVRVTDTVYERVRDLYSLVIFGDIDIQGKGRVQAWTLEG